ncbi:MAG: hypothetical protein Greene041619_628 [Candidatus Peregrinibacteria bacterium Greene0416_19]|nr:MAG: hypothetical protein Greene041619_628 [Candidatus Peregrinibacteria bacterium Greene0416_19]
MIAQLLFICQNPWPGSVTQDPEEIAYLRQNFEKRRELKFCFIRREEELLVFVFPEAFDHDLSVLVSLHYCFPAEGRPDFVSREAKSPYRELASDSFVGAGTYSRRSKGASGYFDSSTCLRRFGWDRPSETAEATRLLELLKEKLKAENILTSEEKTS